MEHIVLEHITNIPTANDGAVLQSADPLAADLTNLIIRS